MKNSRITVAAALAGIFASYPAASGWQELASEVAAQAVAGGTGTGVLSGALSREQMIGGLKSALREGARYAIETLGKQGGFLDNPLVRIKLPENLSLVDSALRVAGKGAIVDEFVGSMNHAAEQAVPEAAEVLADAISQMTIDDALQLLNGGEQAATEYFRRTSSGALKQRLRPLVEQATDSVGATQAYKRLTSAGASFFPETNAAVNNILSGFMGGGAAQSRASPLDLDGYVTDKALDGLFKVIGEQEKLIRTDPAARTTDLLKAVFGS